MYINLLAVSSCTLSFFRIYFLVWRSLVPFFFMNEVRKNKRLIDGWVQLPQQHIVGKKSSQKAKLPIYRSISVPTFTCGHYNVVSDPKEQDLKNKRLK